jgi:hypothetical protein
VISGSDPAATGLKTGLRAIAEGQIGEPLTALAIMQAPGTESWHPSPELLFDTGGGPLFDIGPYYLTAHKRTLSDRAVIQVDGRSFSDGDGAGLRGAQAATSSRSDVPASTAVAAPAAAGAAATQQISSAEDADAPARDGHAGGVAAITILPMSDKGRKP